MKNNLIPFMVIFLCLFYTDITAQQSVGIPGVKVYNFTTFLPLPVQEISAEVLDQTSDNFENHPEFGFLPFDAPCKDCFEIIEKRTFNTRYYLKENSKGVKFYSQASMNDLHYKNHKGQTITIDPHLVPVSGKTGVYRANQQLDPTELNMEEGYTSIQLMDNAIFKFNQQLISYSTDDFTNITNLQKINRSNHTVGYEGAQVIDAFDEIDQQLIFGIARVKSNYLLKNADAFNSSNKFFVIEDEFILPDGYILKYDKYEGEENEFGFWHGGLKLENTNGIELATIEAPIIYDSNVKEIDDINNSTISYVVEQSGNVCKLKMIIETAWLVSSNRVYPITIDPTVYGETAIWSGIEGTEYAPAFCTNTLTVPTPPGASITGSKVYWEFRALGTACGTCKMNFLGVKFNTMCGTSPPGELIWICGGACYTAGTWTAFIEDLNTEDLTSCLIPDCTTYNVDFTVSHYQFQCNTAGTCVTTCDQFLNFQVTIEGETLDGIEICNGFDDDCDAIIDEDIIETVSIIASGPTTFCQGGSVLLTATYTGAMVQWKMDGVNIPGAISSTYNATIKGAYTCATISPCASATSEIIFVNVLKNPLASITAGGSTTFCAGGSVVLSANTGAGLSYQWYKGATLIPGATSINYTATLTGNYKCRVTKIATGCFKNSNTIAVSVPCKEGELTSDQNPFSIYPNPNSGTFTINANVFSERTMLEVYNNIGELIFSKEMNTGHGLINEVIVIKDISSGIYMVKLVSGDLEMVENLIVE